jgi:hypothetical protein
MKKFLLFVAVVVISHNTTISQSCLPDGITFTTQSQIDSIEINYPGCTYIEGTVTIRGNDITNLNGFINLNHIGGKLIIEYCPLLTNLNGLNNLTSIWWHLQINDNVNLVSLSGLQSLQSIEGGLEIYDNPSLTSLTGLDNIEAFNLDFLIIAKNPNLSLCNVESVCNFLSGDFGEINIYNNAPGCLNPVEVAGRCGKVLTCLPKGNYYCTSQSDIDSFKITYPGCTDLKGDLHISGTGITSLSGLSEITSVQGGVEFDSCKVLPGLSGLGNLGHCGWLSVEEAESLKDLTGLEGLNTIDEGIWLARNTSLKSLSGLDNVTSIGGSLNLSSNPALTSLEALNKVASIEGFLALYANNSLVNLSGLENVRSIKQDIWIHKNASLTDLTGLNNLKTVGTFVGIQENAALTSLAGLENLDSIGGPLYINYNPSLSNLKGLKKLTTVGREFDISENKVLLNTDGLENLTSIGWGLWISYNNALTGIGGFKNLTSVGGGFIAIYNNPLLASLQGLEKIDTASISSIYIGENNSLSHCEVKSVCDFLANPAGNYDIELNKPGCNSPEEVYEACTATSAEKLTASPEFTIYPNPSNSQFTFNFYLQKPSIVNLVARNSLGQIITTLLDESLIPGEHKVSWNAEELPAGIYFCRLQAGDQIGSVKAVKMK